MISETWVWISANSSPIQAVCIVAGTIAAFAVIFHNGLISRREATIEMVNAQFGEEGDHYTTFKNLMKDIEAAGSDIADYAEAVHDNSDAQGIILRQLNRYELISLGIKQHVFNENFYKMWFFSQVLRDYGKMEPFITRTRAVYSNDAFFCEFEELVKRWKRKKHPVKHPRRTKILWWVATGQWERAMRALQAAD